MAEAFSLLGVAVLLAALRTYARWTLAGPANFQLDDYLMPLAMVSPVDTVVPRNAG